MKSETLLEVEKAVKTMGINEIDRCISDCNMALKDENLSHTERRMLKKEKSVFMTAMYNKLTPGIIKK